MAKWNSQPQEEEEKGKKKGSWGPTLLVLLMVALAAFLFFKKEITGWMDEKMADISVVQTLAETDEQGDVR